MLYKNCYKCSLVQKLPKEVIPSESKTKADTPHTHFHADVIKRAKQNILTVKDHFTSYQDAMIIESETAEALKNGLIALTTAIRKPKPIFISVDNSPGFASLVMNKDKDLKGLMINMIKTDEVNKNANAVIDKGCRELEEEIKRIEPDGGKLSMPQLKLAILKLNSKLRRKGCISSYELHTARDQNTSANLNLDDKQIRDKQLLSRKAAGDHENNDVQIGDSVQIKNRVNKHKANEVYIITNKLGEQVEMQKVGNPLADKPAKLMIKTYKTKQKYIKTTHRPEHMEHDEDTCNEANTVCNSQKIKPHNQSPWSPIDRHFYGSESDESEDENRNNRNTAVKKKVLNTDRDFHYENEELSWDHSPEQYAFANDTLKEEQNIDEILRPKPIFLDQSSSISSSSHEDVFMKKSPVAPKNPKLKRKNAIRIKKNVTEPRVTRRSLTVGIENTSRSQGNSPPDLNLDVCQNLSPILRPRHPVASNAVVLDQVQNLSNVLQATPPGPSRRTLRSKAKVDYYRLHHGEDYDDEH